MRVDVLCARRCQGQRMCLLSARKQRPASDAILFGEDVLRARMMRGARMIPTRFSHGLLDCSRGSSF
jgi:hypothetical protein